MSCSSASLMAESARTDCVAGASFGPSGTLSVPDQPVGSSISEEQQQEFIHACSIEAGQPIIEALEFDMRVNPDHRDFNELYTQCLIRNKAVEPPFTAQELARARKSGTPLASALPFIDPAQGPDILQTCLEEPSTRTRVVTGNVDGTDGELSEAGGWRRDENITIPPASPHELTSPIAGRITALQAAPETPVTSGSLPRAIAGLPPLASALWSGRSVHHVLIERSGQG